jgi:hypothetical protein
VRESPDEQCGKFEINPENYRIFPANSITDGMEAQPYSDQFPRHHIPFSYRSPYLPNNTKMTRKYEKTEPKFPRILPTVFTLTWCNNNNNNQAFYSQTSWGRLEMKPHKSEKEGENKGR